MKFYLMVSFTLGQKWLPEHSAAFDYGKKHFRPLKGGKVNKLVCESFCMEVDNLCTCLCVLLTCSALLS